MIGPLLSPVNKLSPSHFKPQRRAKADRKKGNVQAPTYYGEIPKTCVTLDENYVQCLG